MLDYSPGGGWPQLLNNAYQRLKQSQSLPSQTKSKLATMHPLDKKVIDYLVDNILTPSNIKISAVRAGFEEGREIFINSALYDKTHIQVAIRNKTVIQKSSLLQANDFKV